MRLTLRSAEDGRYLARIIEREGYAFVLDFGDRGIIEDVAQRLRHGFTLWRFGEMLTAMPQSDRMLEMLADHYVREGCLVFLEEPGHERAAEPPTDEEPLALDLILDLPERDDLTELISDLTAEVDITPGAVHRRFKPFIPPPSVATPVRAGSFEDDEPTQDLVEDDPTELLIRWDS